MQLWVKICLTCTEVSHKCILSMPKQVLLWRERFLCVYEPVIPAVRIRNDVTMRALARCESMERREKLFLVFHFEKGRRKEKKRSWCRDVYPDDACSFRDIVLCLSTLEPCCCQEKGTLFVKNAKNLVKRNVQLFWSKKSKRTSLFELPKKKALKLIPYYRLKVINGCLVVT